MANGETVVIGGLIRDDDRAGRSAVPCLGSLPGAGWLFKRETIRAIRLNLLILISPTIIRTPEQMRAATEQMRNKVRERVEGEREYELNEDKLKNKNSVK